MYDDFAGKFPRELPYRTGYGKSFDFTFYWFKPFVKVSSVDVRDYQPMVNSDMRKPGGRPFEELNDIGFREGSIYSWSNVSNDLGLENLGQIECGYLTSWNHLPENEKRRDIASAIDLFCEEQNLIELSDDVVTEFEARMLSDVLLSAGTKEIETFDIIGEVQQKISLPSLVSKKDYSWHSRVSEPKKSFLVDNYFNEFTTEISGSFELKRAILEHGGFEGFFANELTNHDWWKNLDSHIGEWKLI